MTTTDISATLATVEAKMTARGPVAVTLTHASTDAETFWSTDDVEALVLDAAGLHPGEYTLDGGVLAVDGDGTITEEVRVRRV